MARCSKTEAKMPIMTIDADLAAADRAQRTTYLGTNNYDMGVLMAKHLKGLKPKGGTVCLQLGNVAADNINARAAGFRDTISGKKGVAKLAGDGGWTEVAGCPLFTNDQIDLANQQMADVFTKNPKLDAFILVGGWAQFGPQAYAQVPDQVMAKLKSKELISSRRHAAAAAGCAEEQAQPRAIGQRPFEMGYKAPSVLIDLINKRSGGPALHRPGRVHAGQPWQVPGQVGRAWRSSAERSFQELRRHPGADRRLAVAASRRGRRVDGRQRCRQVHAGEDHRGQLSAK